MPRRGVFQGAQLPKGPGGAKPGGEVDPDRMPKIVREGGREVKALWRQVLSEEMWGSVAGQADLHVISQYCVTSVERDKLFATIKHPRHEGEYGHLPPTNQLSLLARWESAMHKTQLEFSRRVIIYAVKGAKGPRAGAAPSVGPRAKSANAPPPGASDAPWASGRVQ